MTARIGGAFFNDVAWTLGFVLYGLRFVYEALAIFLHYALTALHEFLESVWVV